MLFLNKFVHPLYHFCACRIPSPLMNSLLYSKQRTDSEFEWLSQFFASPGCEESARETGLALYKPPAISRGMPAPRPLTPAAARRAAAPKRPSRPPQSCSATCLGSRPEPGALARGGASEASKASLFSWGGSLVPLREAFAVVFVVLVLFLCELSRSCQLVFQIG